MPTPKKKPRPRAKSRPKRRVGRPRKEVKEGEIDRIERLAGFGFTIPLLAASVGLGETAFRERIAQDPRISEALERGKAKMAESLAGTLVHQAVRKKNVHAAIWLEKSRYGMTEKHQVEHTHVKREEVVRVMDDMAAVVEKYVLDEETREKIRAGWLALRLA